MRFAAYVIFLFCVAVALYFIGYTNLLSFYLSNTATSGQTVVNNLSEGILNDASGALLVGLVISLGAGVIANFLGQGYAAIYLIPLIMLGVIMSYMVFPYSFIFDAGLPQIIRQAGLAFFNIITVLAVISFVRGGA